MIQVNKIQFKETARVPLVLECYRPRRNNQVSDDQIGSI